MNSREQILSRLRQRQRPFSDAPPPPLLPVTPRGDDSAAALHALFVQQAQQAGCVVHAAATPAAAVAVIASLTAGETAVSCWDAAHIGVPGLAAALDAQHVARVGPDAQVRIGLTGVDAALAATGSVLLCSGPGRPRAASLLPPLHIAVVRRRQIVPDLEYWWAQQRADDLAAVRRASNVVVITGPSRTADIAMQMVMGMHGPRELHLVLVESA